MEYSSLPFDWAERRMGQPIPPPPARLFHSPIRALQRTFWRLIFGLFFALTYGYLGAMSPMSIFNDDILVSMDEYQLALPIPCLVITAFLSGQGTHQPAGQQAGFLETQAVRFLTASNTVVSFAFNVAAGVSHRFQRFVSQAARREFLWHVFWDIYFVFGPLTHFQNDVLVAWNRHLTHELSPGERLLKFQICIDNGVRMEVPCAQNLDDKSFLTHLYYFYGFAKTCSVSLPRLSLRSLGRVEISQILQGDIVGNRVSVMDLGRVEGNRIVHLLYHRDHLEGDARVRELIQRGVITNEGVAKLCCVNFVSVWGSATAGFIVGMPVFLGFLCCIIWPTVAVRAFDEDVQTSVQTGFAAGSFIVTASAVLVALVTFLDAAGGNRWDEGASSLSIRAGLENSRRRPRLRRRRGQWVYRRRAFA